MNKVLRFAGGISVGMALFVTSGCVTTPAMLANSMIKSGSEVSMPAVPAVPAVKTGKTNIRLNVRKAPKGKRLGTFDAATMLTIHNEENGWLEVSGTIKTKIVKGWVNKKYVEVSAPKQTATTKTPPQTSLSDLSVSTPEQTATTKTPSQTSLSDLLGMMSGESAPGQTAKTKTPSQTSMSGLLGIMSGGSQGGESIIPNDPNAILDMVSGSLNNADPMNLTATSIGQAVISRGADILTGNITGKVENLLLEFDAAATLLRLSQDIMEHTPISDLSSWPEQLAYEPGDRKQVFRNMLEEGLVDMTSISGLFQPVDVVAHTISDRFYEIPPSYKNRYQGKVKKSIVGSGKTNRNNSVVDGVISMIPADMNYSVEATMVEKYNLSKDIYSTAELWREYENLEGKIKSLEARKSQAEAIITEIRDSKKKGSDFLAASDPMTEAEKIRIQEQESLINKTKPKLELLQEKQSVYFDGLKYILGDGLQKRNEVLEDHQQPLARNLLLAAHLANEMSFAAAVKVASASSNIMALPLIPQEINTLQQRIAQQAVLGGAARLERLMNAAKSLGYQVPMVSSQLFRQKRLTSLVEAALRNMLGGAKFDRTADSKTCMTMWTPQPITLSKDVMLLEWPDPEGKAIAIKHPDTKEKVMLQKGTQVDVVAVSVCNKKKHPYYQAQLRLPRPAEAIEEAKAMKESESGGGVSFQPSQQEEDITSVAVSGWIWTNKQQSIGDNL